ERRCVHTFDIVQVQLGNQRKRITQVFSPLGEMAHIVPGWFHVFVFHVAQPSAKYRQQESVAHQRAPASSGSCERALTIAASASSQSTSFTKGSKPITRGPSATKFESALMS